VPVPRDAFTPLDFCSSTVCRMHGMCVCIRSEIEDAGKKKWNKEYIEKRTFCNSALS